jgi:predicted polyphosphate/ATP-dependent NAD kinase
MRKVGFVVNPIAGMGGRVGLKGTDDVLQEAIARGATPRASERAMEMLTSLLETDAGGVAGDVVWLTCSGIMGADVLARSGVPGPRTRVVHPVAEGAATTAGDTREACAAFEREGAELVVFCGGDGTARDVLAALDARLPVLGVPAGVKMHSGVFGLSPQAAAETLLEFLEGRLTVADAEVIDLDEDAYREGEWRIRLHGTARTPHAPALIQAGKFMTEASSEQLVLEDIAQGISEYMEESPHVLWVLGPGGTLKFIGDWIEIDKTLLGIDAVADGRQVGKDLDERGLLALLEQWPDARVVVSPIGAQGFFLGRGNLQLSPEVVRRVGVDNFWVVSTPSKLDRTPALRVDTGDGELDGQFTARGQMQVLMGYRTRKYVPLR